MERGIKSELCRSYRCYGRDDAAKILGMTKKKLMNWQKGWIGQEQAILAGMHQMEDLSLDLKMFTRHFLFWIHRKTISNNEIRDGCKIRCNGSLPNFV